MEDRSLAYSETKASPQSRLITMMYRLLEHVYAIKYIRLVDLVLQESPDLKIHLKLLCKV